MSEKESDHESEIEDSSDQSINTSQIKQKISLKNQQLRQLSNDDVKFFQTIISTNDKAVERILSTSSKQALVYLGQAQRILQYGACCGKVIDRNLIICVLHNEAAAYQRIWALDKCSKYIEAVIYNIELSLGSESGTYNENELEQANFKNKEYEMLCSIMKRKLYLVQYHLQYCAIISQLKNHAVALASSTKALYLIKEIIEICYKYYIKNVYKEKQEKQIAARKLKFLKQLSQYKQSIDQIQYQHLLKRVKYVYKEWRIQKDIQKQDEMQEWIKTYSIGNVMQMEPSTYKDYDNLKEFTTEFHLQNLTKKILLFAISYFTIATEIRLIEAQKYSNQQQKKNSVEFRKSEIYHLTAIKIFCTYIPYQSMFIKHVLHSYSNHYKPQLKDDNAPFIIDDQLVQKQKLQNNTNAKKSIHEKQKDKQIIMNENFNDNYKQQIIEDFYDKVNNDHNDLEKQQYSGNENEIEEDNQNHIKPLNPDIVQKKKNKKQKIQIKNPVITIRPQTGKAPSSKNKMISPKGNNTVRVFTAKIYTNKQNPINQKSRDKINSISKQRMKQTSLKSPRAPLKADFKKYIKQKPKQKKKETIIQNNSYQLQAKSQNKKIQKNQKKETPVPLKNECEYFPKKSKSKPKQKKK